jgi:hypothetical protein
MWYTLVAYGDPYNEDALWAVITFHCLGEGTSVIEADGFAWPVTGLKSELAPSESTVNQVPPNPVGGVLVPVNKLEILAPYVALAGLIATVTIVIVKIRSRKPE